MKYIFAFLTILGLTSFTYAQENDKPIDQSKVTIDERPAPTKANYVAALEDFQTWLDNFDKPSYYKSPNDTKFEDFDSFQKNSVYIWSLQQLEKRLTIFKSYWEQEIKQVKTTDDKLHPTKSDVKQYLVKLHELRKSAAFAHEEFASKFCAEFINKIGASQAEHYMKQIKKFHDDEKLVDRDTKKNDKV